jgi:hypothetical protein
VSRGQLAFWKDQVNGIVTNDKNQCDAGPSGAVNRIAGIFQLAVTAGGGVAGSDGNPLQYMCDLIIRKPNAGVLLSTAPTLGVQVIGDTTASTARGLPVATVTTAPVSQVVGVVASATAITGSIYPVNVAIAFAE